MLVSLSARRLAARDRGGSNSTASANPSDHHLWLGLGTKNRGGAKSTIRQRLPRLRTETRTVWRRRSTGPGSSFGVSSSSQSTLAVHCSGPPSIDPTATDDAMRWWAVNALRSSRSSWKPLSERRSTSPKKSAALADWSERLASSTNRLIAASGSESCACDAVADTKSPASTSAAKSRRHGILTRPADGRAGTSMLSADGPVGRRITLRGKGCA